MPGKPTPGVVERHSRGCGHPDTPCSCTPTFQAWVWIPRERKKKRETFATRAAAKNWLTDNRKPARDGKLRVGDGKVTVAAWLEGWLAERAPQDASPRVVGLYRQSVDTHIVPSIGHIKLVSLRRSDCNELVSELFKKGLARNTIKRTISPLRLALAFAVDEEEIAGNPAAGLDIPKKAPERTLHVPTLPEVNRILEKASKDGKDAILLAASLGLRRCELLALRWSDVDFTHNMIRVSQKNVGGVIEEGSKTDAGIRMVPLYATARTALEARAERLGLRLQWLPADERLIFANARGGPFEPTNWSRRVWQTARDAAGADLADVRFHDLRHFSVTRLRELGMEGKLRSVVTGHTDTRTTERIYDHVRPEHVEEAATKFDPLAG